MVKPLFGFLFLSEKWKRKIRDFGPSDLCLPSSASFVTLSVALFSLLGLFFFCWSSGQYEARVLFEFWETRQIYELPTPPLCFPGDEKGGFLGSSSSSVLHDFCAAFLSGMLHRKVPVSPLPQQPGPGPGVQAGARAKLSEDSSTQSLGQLVPSLLSPMFLNSCWMDLSLDHYITVEPSFAMLRLPFP